MNDDYPDVAAELQAVFQRLSEEGFRPAFDAWVAELEANGEVSHEAADLLRRGDREAIEQHLERAEGPSPRPLVFWPPFGT